MKNELRKEALEKRKMLNCNELSEKIIKNLISLPEYRSSKDIICYYPLKYEADTKMCLEDNQKNWYLPRVNGEALDICPFGNLSKGAFGILEPMTNPISDYEKINMVIIPACAADKSGYRIGWGKGYYDRFLPLLKQTCKKVVLIYSSLLYNTIYPDKNDVKADIIVTDKGIFRIDETEKF